MSRLLLSVNAGSSSVKLAVHDMDGVNGAVPLQRISLDIAAGSSASDLAQRAALEAESLRTALGVLAWSAVAHRVVHGSAVTAPCRIDAAVLAAIREAAPHAPLHNPLALALVAAFDRTGHGEAQYAVFDTGFFADLPEAVARYALPEALSHGARRRGFHGLAHASLWQQAKDCWNDRAPLRVITLQLGAGASVAAVQDGRALEISMGYSTLEGLMMATRCGDLDPGLLLEMLTAPGADPAQIRHDLYHASGLLGVSGRSSRLSELLDHDEDPRCRLAVEMYCHRIRRHIGASLAVLGGADALIFGGGVGENEPRLRARILQDLGWAGFALDATANAWHTTAGSPGCRAIGAGDPATRRRVLVGTVDESQQMARILKPLIDRDAAAGPSAAPWTH